MGKVLAPHASVTRDDNLQSSVRNVTSKYVFSLFIFFIFLGSTRGLPLLLRVFKCDEEFRPT